MRYRQHGVQAFGALGAPGIIDNATRVRAYEDLRAPIADLASRGIAPRPDAVRRIDDKLRYLRAVKDASGAPPPRRALIAWRDLLRPVVEVLPAHDPR